MATWRTISLGLRRLLRPTEARRDVDDELRDYFASATEAYIHAGMTPVEAARQVRATFGTAAAARDEAASGGWDSHVDTLLRDFRYALRALRKNPGFAAVAVLSLGLGIGAATTTFSVIDALDFRPLPFPNAERLVWLSETTPADYRACASCAWTTAPGTAADWAAESRSYDAFAAREYASIAWMHDDVHESLQSARATPGALALLGARPFLGRGFLSSDTAFGAEPVALVSYEFWQSRLSGDTAAVGRALIVDGASSGPPVPTGMIVVGVLPPGFRFMDYAAVWTPLRLNATRSRANRELWVVARLKPDQTIRSATAELQILTSRLTLAYPADYRGWGADVRPVREMLTAGAAKGRAMLFAITMLVLLIAMLNVASLLLGRAAARQQDYAVRRALGASRPRLVRQMLTEGSCIGLGGGTIGVLLALWGAHVIPQWLSTTATGLPVGVDGRMLLFATLVSWAAGVGAAVVPGLRATSPDSIGVLRAPSTDGGAHSARTSAALLTAQVALALVLVTAAGLLTRDFLELRFLDLGYDPKALYSTTLSDLREKPIDPAQWAAIAEAARSRVAQIPGVAVAALDYRSAIHPSIVRPANGAPLDNSIPTPGLTAIDPAYFSAFGTPMLSGRSFTVADGRSAPLVAIVNLAAARAFWPGQNPLSRRVFVGDSESTGELLTVVGVAANAERGERISRQWPIVYRPMQQAKIYQPAGELYLRLSDRTPAALRQAVAAIRQTTGHSVAPFKSELENVDERFLSQRLNALALDLFAGFGLLLAAIGIYGSVAYTVTQRTREIGIRMALGAESRSVVGLAARRVSALTALGIAAGAAGSFALTRLLRSFLVETSTTNPWLFAAAIVLTALTAAAATLIPARRAARVDPVIALRGE